MELKQGDWDNLEGKVMIYAKFLGDVPTLDPVLQEHARELPFIALYFSSDAEDFKSKMSAPAEHFEHGSDIAKAKKLLGWEPIVSIEEGMKVFVDWFVKKDF